MPLRHHGCMFDLFERDHTYGMLVITVNTSRIMPNGCSLLPSRYGPMGKGCAAQAARLWPEFRVAWAAKLAESPTVRFYAWRLSRAGNRLVGALATKANWWNPSKPDYIACSLRRMQEWLTVHESGRIIRTLMPLPGAGQGGLSEETCLGLVRHLSDEFTVCTI